MHKSHNLWSYKDSRMLIFLVLFVRTIRWLNRHPVYYLFIEEKVHTETDLYEHIYHQNNLLQSFLVRLEQYSIRDNALKVTPKLLETKHIIIPGQEICNSLLEHQIRVYSVPSPQVESIYMRRLSSDYEDVSPFNGGCSWLSSCRLRRWQRLHQQSAD